MCVCTFVIVKFSNFADKFSSTEKLQYKFDKY